MRQKQGLTDSLMLDHEGNIAEATGANVFLKTKLMSYILQYLTHFRRHYQKRIINIAKKRVKVIERKIVPREMAEFVGCFLTGTAAEVTPVSQINEYQFKVCEIITELNEAYQNLVRKKDSAA